MWKQLIVCITCASSALAAAPRIGISADGKSFVRDGQAFHPWGFNYDRDYRIRLLEDYWEKEWETVEQDFREMKQLGANVVRIHLQFAKFMDAPDKPNADNLERLQRLARLAEQIGLYLDITGLGCYRKTDAPAWYDALDEQERWQAQANFWSAIAQACADSPAVFCYDLMNEPIVPAAALQKAQWVHPVAIAGLHYAQHITLDPRGRDLEAIAQRWTQQMIAAIRAHDRDHLITIGMLPFEKTGFAAQSLAPHLDFIAVHIYPEAGKLDDALRTLDRFDAGKPIVIEEIFPMKCSIEELEQFITRSRPIADGWIGFYWGQTPSELKPPKKIGDAFLLAWLELFQRMQRD